MNAAKRSTYALLVSVAACSDAHERLPWSAALEDVDCRVLLADAGISNDNYWQACAAVDTDPNTRAQADELFRRLSWNLFVYFMTPPYDWRERTNNYKEWLEATDLTTARLVRSRTDQTCAAVDSQALEFFARPHWEREADGGARDSPPALIPQPLWDQNGHLVEIEAPLLNRPELHEERLDSVQGQVQDLCGTDTRSTAWGTLFQSSNNQVAVPSYALHLKLAWRDITDDAECERYGFVTRSGAACGKGQQGLVAAHIVAKTSSQGDYWLWSTFSHRDNVEARPGVTPLFNDPSCSDCVPNTCPPLRAGLRKTQVERLHPIPDEVAETKRIGLAEHHIPEAFERYDLLGIQRLPAIVSNDPVLPTPHPSALTNELIEWDRQDSNCISCHSHARVAAVPDQQAFCSRACQGDCRFCLTETQQPGVCEQAQESCGTCIPVQRASRYFVQPMTTPYPMSDMAWIYDHYWNDTGQKP
jgi:hypothetical protein